jgi:hypothetical protein
MPHVICRAERPAGIARGRLDPDLLERTVAQDPAVAHAVERDAARHAQILRAGHFVHVTRRLEHRVFGDGLDRRREVHVAFRDRRLRPARRTAEQLVEFRRRHRQALTVVEERHVHPDGPIVFDVDDCAANLAGLAWAQRALSENLQRYDEAIKASGDWSKALGQVGLDMPYEDPPDDKKLQETFDLWLRSSRQMRLLAEANGIGYVHVVQPYLMRSKPHLTNDEEALVRTIPESHYYTRPARVIYQMFEDHRNLLDAHGIVSAVNLFAERSDKMYVDPFHYTGPGETLIAEFIAAEASRWIEECDPEFAMATAAGSTPRCQVGDKLRAK